ncbi:MAG: sulfatase-like hydrolase/transferase [Bacilli bacterium]|nr:sulfatase-like hydrolase/transferase [Bacilli bacterium]
MKIVKNFFKRLKKNVKNRIKVIKRDHLIRKYFSDNVLFLTFVITGVLNSTILRFLCMHSVENYLSWKAILADTIVVTAIGAFGYFIKPKDRFIYYFGFCIFLTAICMINSVYYTFYTSFASISMLSLTQYIGDVGDAVVENVLQLKDLVYIISPLILLGVHLKLKKKNYYKKVELKTERRKLAFKTLSVSGALLVIFLLTLSSLDISRFFKQWNKEYIVMRFGIYVYQANDLVASVQPKVNAMFGYDKASKEFNDYFAEVPDKAETNQYTDIFKGKNVIVIHAESMMTNVIDLKFNDQEVTPNLNKLAHTGMYFNNFYSQVSVGTSSDSELTYNTSLMPTKSGTAFVSYSNRKYIGIPTLLNEQGYYTFSMHANNADFWNRRTMHKNMGYQRFYSKTDYEIDKENVIGLGLSDKEFFRQSAEKIEKINEEHDKWYGLLIMLTNHTPFSEVDKYGEFPVDIKETITNEDGTTEEIVYPYMEGTKLGNYFKSIHYADSALGEFLTELDQKHLLDNTVFVLYGDHDARLPRKNYNRLYNYDKENDTTLDEEDPEYKEYDSYQYEIGRRVPFIIWTKDMEGSKLNFTNSNVMGMYDVVPTLGNMFGFYNKYAFGHDIYNINDNNIVCFPNGNWVTNKVYYNSQKAAYLPLTEEPISEEEIANNVEYTNKLLDVSNNIIVFDLLNEDKNKELKEVTINK